MVAAAPNEYVQTEWLIGEPLALRPRPHLPSGTGKWCIYAWECYAFAWTAAMAVYSSSSYHKQLPEEKKAQLYATRLLRVRHLESIYLDELAKAEKNARRRASARRSAAKKASTQLKLFSDGLPADFLKIVERFPHRPRVSNDFELYGSTVRSLESAVGFKYIQHNPPAYDHLLVIDYDAPDGIPVEDIWKLKKLPEPFWIAKTPGSPKGHLAWPLKTPVCSTQAARVKPLEYLARIEQGFMKVLQGDTGYVGHMTKNPAHPSAWEMIWFPCTLYSLDELAAAVDILRYTDKFKKKKAESKAAIEPVGIGRKVHTFNDVRYWAYSAIGPFWGGPFDFWRNAVMQKAYEVNRSFSEPLRESVVRAIAKSVARWVWREFTPQRRALLIASTHTPEIQAKRGAKKGAIKREELIERARSLHATGKSNRAIAADLGVDHKTIGNWLNRSE